MGRKDLLVFVCGVGVLLSSFFSLGAESPPPVRLVEDVRLALEIRPILVVDGQSGALPPKRLPLDPATGGSLAFEMDWPEPGRASRLELRASGEPGPEDGEHRLHVQTRLDLPDGRTFRASRELAVRDGATGLIEVFREEGRSLTLGVKADRIVRGLRVEGRHVGDPIVFHLEVEGIRGERGVALETNRLHTFMGETVEYSFRRGEGDAVESVQLLLTPLRRGPSIVEVSLEIAGSLPGEGERLLLSRSETLVTSRLATSSVTVTAGAPASGYRFRITPDF